MNGSLTEEEQLLIQKNKLRWADILGSAFLFASAYLLLYIIYDLATAVTAAHFGVVPTLFFDTIGFQDSNDWYPRAVKITFSIGAPVMLITGIGFYVLQASLKTSPIVLRLFLLWLSLLSFVILSQRLIGVFFASDFQFRSLDSLGLELGIVAAYFYMNAPEKFALAFTGLLLSISIGFLYAKPFLQTATSIYQIDIPLYRKRFLRHHLITPAVLGAAIITIGVFPMNTVPNLMTFAVLPLSLVSVWFFAMVSNQLIRRQSFSRFWFLLPVLLFGAVMYLIHGVLKFGIAIPDFTLF